MEEKKLFNPNGNDSLKTRQIIGGNSTNLFNLNNVKYKWANKLYRLMMENFWIPEKIPLHDDSRYYTEMTEDERKAYDGILSFLVFLDSIQTNNLPNINDFITAPEINLILSIQTYQEAIHSQSYAYIIESIIPAERREVIYDQWREDKILFERNKYIAEIYQNFVDDTSDKNFAKVLIANFLLEGIYFYNGFNFFYDLASRNLMLGTANEIKYINRDELTHCVLFANLIKDIKIEKPDFFDDEIIIEMFKTAVEQEIEWSKHIIGDAILGMNEKSIEAYTKYIANKRLREIGMNPIYEGFDKNPYKHLEKIADTHGQGDTKGNFLETTVSAYNQSSAIDGWDDF